MAYDADASGPKEDPTLLTSAGKGLIVGTASAAAIYGLVEPARSIDSAGLDKMWEAASVFYQPAPEGATNVVQVAAEHVRHIAELTATIGPAAVALFVGGNLSLRSAREFGSGKPVQASAHFAGSLVCYALVGGWSTGSRLLATSSDLMHDPRTLPTLAAAGVFALVGAGYNGLLNGARHLASATTDRDIEIP